MNPLIFQILLSIVTGVVGIGVAVIGYFLSKTLNRMDDSAGAMIKLATAVELLIERNQNNKLALEKHETASTKEHERIDEELVFLAQRDHELQNMIAGIVGYAVTAHDWDIGDMPSLSRRGPRKAAR